MKVKQDLDDGWLVIEGLSAASPRFFTDLAKAEEAARKSAELDSTMDTGAAYIVKAKRAYAPGGPALS